MPRLSEIDKGIWTQLNINFNLEKNKKQLVLYARIYSMPSIVVSLKIFSLNWTKNSHPFIVNALLNLNTSFLFKYINLKHFFSIFFLFRSY